MHSLGLFRPAPGMALIQTVSVRLPSLHELKLREWAPQPVVTQQGLPIGNVARLQAETFANPQRFLSRNEMAELRRHRAQSNHQRLAQRSPWRKRARG